MTPAAPADDQEPHAPRLGLEALYVGFLSLRLPLLWRIQAGKVVLFNVVFALAWLVLERFVQTADGSIIDHSASSQSQAVILGLAAACTGFYWMFPYQHQARLKEVPRFGPKPGPTVTALILLSFFVWTLAAYFMPHLTEARHVVTGLTVAEEDARRDGPNERQRQIVIERLLGETASANSGFVPAAQPDLFRTPDLWGGLLNDRRSFDWGSEPFISAMAEFGANEPWIEDFYQHEYDTIAEERFRAAFVASPVFVAIVEDLAVDFAAARGLHEDNRADDRVAGIVAGGYGDDPLMRAASSEDFTTALDAIESQFAQNAAEPPEFLTAAEWEDFVARRRSSVFDFANAADPLFISLDPATESDTIHDAWMVFEQTENRRDWYERSSARRAWLRDAARRLLTSEGFAASREQSALISDLRAQTAVLRRPRNLWLWVDGGEHQFYQDVEQGQLGLTVALRRLRRNHVHSACGALSCAVCLQHSSGRGYRHIGAPVRKLGVRRGHARHARGT